LKESKSRAGGAVHRHCHLPRLPTAFKVQGKPFKVQVFSSFIQVISSHHLNKALVKLESFSRNRVHGTMYKYKDKQRQTSPQTGRRSVNSLPPPSHRSAPTSIDMHKSVDSLLQVVEVHQQAIQSQINNNQSEMLLWRRLPLWRNLHLMMEPVSTEDCVSQCSPL
jgi:hypothetical protein